MLLDVKVPNNRSGKVVRIKCDDCGKEKDVNFCNYKRSQESKNFSGETLCISCSSKRTAKSRIGKVAWNKGLEFPDRQGENSVSWRGGKYIDIHGYVMIYHRKLNVDITSKWEHYRKEHVVVMEDYIGRDLLDHEQVHHIDGDRKNNSISNLYLTDKNEHHKLHHSLQELGYKLIKEGLIIFDTDLKKYVAHTKLGELLEHPEEDNQQPS